LRATLAELGLSKASAVYPVGVQVFGTPDASSSYTVIGQATTFITLAGDKRVPVTNLVRLDAPPTKLADSLFANEDLAAELNPQGDLGRLVKLLDTIGPLDGYAIDPALLDEIADMANGYEVVLDDGLKPGTGQAHATAWLRKYRMLKGTGVRTLFANPDLNSKDCAKLVENAMAAKSPIATGLPLVVIPPRFEASADNVAAAAAAKFDAVLAANLRDSGALKQAGKQRVLALTTADSHATLLAAQYQLAQTFVAGAAGQLRLIAQPQDAAKWAEVTQPWMQTRPFAQLLEEEPTATARFAKFEAQTLTDAGLSRIANAGKEINTYADLVADAKSAIGGPELLARAASSSWIGNEAGQKAYLGQLSGLIGSKALNAAVEIQAVRRFLMSSEANEFPITVTNKLSEPIEVKITTESLNPQRLQVPDSQVVLIEPGVSQVVNIHPHSDSNGVIEVLSHVTTTSGARVSKDVRITISVTNLSFVGWAIVIVSGGAVVLLTALRIRQKRQGDSEPGEATFDTPAASDSAAAPTTPPPPA
jgi:hypothetical protein